MAVTENDCVESGKTNAQVISIAAQRSALATVE